MSRRLIVGAVAASLALTGAALPSYAAAAKPKPITVTYKVSLVPDPTLNVGTACSAVIPAAQDERVIALPAKGTLKVSLAGGDLPGPAAGNGDWDLYTLDANGDLLSSSESAGVMEETVDKVKGRTSMSIWVCNLAGTPDGTVTYTFTYA